MHFPDEKFGCYKSGYNYENKIKYKSLTKRKKKKKEREKGLDRVHLRFSS